MLFVFFLALSYQTGQTGVIGESTYLSGKNILDAEKSGSAGEGEREKPFSGVRDHAGGYFDDVLGREFTDDGDNRAMLLPGQLAAGSIIVADCHKKCCFPSLYHNLSYGFFALDL